MDLARIPSFIEERILLLEGEPLEREAKRFRETYGRSIATATSTLGTAAREGSAPSLSTLATGIIPVLWDDAQALIPERQEPSFDDLLPSLYAMGSMMRRVEAASDRRGAPLRLSEGDLEVLNPTALTLMDSLVASSLRLLIDQRVGDLDFGDVASAIQARAPALGRGRLRTDRGQAAEQPEPDGRVFELWFATNRERLDGKTLGDTFGTERDASGAVHHGTCSVEVPRSHTFGSTGTKWHRRWLRFRFRDDHLRLVELSCYEKADEFFAALREEIGADDGGRRHACVYLHGYNVSFEEAAIRAAQIGFDLKIQPMSFFSWPSTGTVAGYFADQDRIEASENEIADFLVRMARDTGAEQVHLIAHSMGNRGLARALQRITARASGEAGVAFGQLILAAPDLSVDLFRDLAAVYPVVSRRTTLYASSRDRALALSSFLQDCDRAGFTPPVTVVDGIDTVEVSGLDLDVLGHGYYASAEPVLYDMLQLLQSGAEPAKRPRLRSVKTPQKRVYWTIDA